MKKGDHIKNGDKIMFDAYLIVAAVLFMFTFAANTVIEMIDNRILRIIVLVVLVLLAEFGLLTALKDVV